MTGYQIEVRAIEERHDVQAHRIAREILQLPTNRLPSLAAALDANRSADSPPSSLRIRTAHLYRLIGNVSAAQVDQLTGQLLVNPVVQEVHTAGYPANVHVVDVFFHPGVTDTLAESVLAGAQMLDITGLERVETGQRYVLDERLSEADVRAIAQALLYNPVIQQYALHRGTDAGMEFNISELSYPVPEGATNWAPTYVAISTMSNEQLIELSKKSLLSLNLDEMCTIQQHLRKQGREPTYVE